MSAAWQLFDAIGLTLGECLQQAGYRAQQLDAED